MIGEVAALRFVAYEADYVLHCSPGHKHTHARAGRRTRRRTLNLLQITLKLLFRVFLLKLAVIQYAYNPYQLPTRSPPNTSSRQLPPAGRTAPPA